MNRRRGGIKVCDRYAELIKESASNEINKKGRVDLRWVEENRRLALWDERNHKETEFWGEVLTGSRELKDFLAEREKWSKRER